MSKYINIEEKVACNPTNSAGIDIKGNLFVWGSKRYGLVWGPEQASGSLKTLNIPKPTKLVLDIQNLMESYGMRDDNYKILTKDGKEIEFTIHKLLDPPRSSNEQINYATHISLGAYHGGVICHDITTNYEFIYLSGNIRSILDDLTIFLFKTWDLLERQNVEEVTKIQYQYFKYYEKFINSTQNETTNKEEAKRTRTKSMKHAFSEKSFQGNTVASKGEGGGGDTIKQGEVSMALKIEFALRYLSKDYSVSSFPFVPIQKVKHFLEVGNINIRDLTALKKLLLHLTKCFNQQKGQLSRKKQQTLHEIQQLDPEITDWFNLKELRDQLIGYRQGSGKLFMFGMKSEGRLGDGGISSAAKGKGDSSDEGQSFDIITEKNFQVIFKLDSKPNDNEDKEEVAKNNIIQIDTKVQICKIQCGSSFTLAMSTAGNLYSWGFGKSGSLGLGEISYISTPQMIKKLHNNSDCIDMMNICSGSSHSLSLDRNGKVYSWGNGQAGRLGHGKEVGENLPRQIMSLDGQFVKQIEAGEASSACITYDGFVYMWGSGQNGRLGNGQKENENKPALSMELQGFQVNQIIMGNNSSFAILSNNKVFGWGSSKSGKLGFELASGKNYELPREIISLSNYPIFQIAAGSFHTLLLTQDGKILVMGNSKDGKLGLNFENMSAIQDIELPEIVEMPDKVNNGSKWFIQDMTIVDEKKYPLLDEYVSYKLFGKLVPVCMKDICYEIVQLAAGENFQMFLTNNGELYACGQNKYGQIGKEEQESEEEEEEKDEDSEEKEEEKKDEDGEHKEGEGSLFMAPELRKRFDKLKKIQEQWEPIQIKTKVLGTITKVKFVATGAAHALCILETSKEVLAWGNNKYGQLGTLSNLGEPVFFPTPVKGLMTEEDVIQIACGEKHTLFLMSNGQVMSCGSNEFGQLGLYFDSIDQEGTKIAGKEPITVPSTILAKHCDNIVFIACGRFHSVAIRKQTNADELRDEDDEEEGQQGKGGNQKDKSVHFDDEFEKRVVVEVKHDLYTWGRGYQGQLGQKDLIVAQWLPKRVFFRKDKAFKENEQPNSFAMVTCGEKHTMVLTNCGYIWWSGEKYAVGKEDPNLERKNKYEVKDEMLSYQQIFTHFFDVIPSKHGQKILFKNVSSNFNAKLSFAIDEQNKPYIFGENIPFQEMQIKKGISLATAGKNFQTILSRDRLPFTWGDLKHGRLGLGEIEHNSKKKKVLQPIKIPYFQQELRDTYDFVEGKFYKEALLPKMREDYNKMYFRENLNIEMELKDDVEIRNFEAKFEMQAILKKEDQERIESDLIQQDTDLIISFKSCIAQIYDAQKKRERQLMMKTMKSQDVINAVVETFPIKKIDLLNDVVSPIPKLILLNKQVYEILFCLLQTHPCYLVNWICAALKQEVDLFDYHPQSHLDDFPEWDEIQTHSNQYYSISEQHILHDEVCLLIMCVYGGWKNIRNDRRIISNLITIGIKVFEFELEESAKSEPKVQFKLAEILAQQVETGFVRICRLVFQSQTCNVAFVDEMAECIVNLLNSNRGKFITQAAALLDERTRKEVSIINQQCFDFESCISNDDLSQSRADKLAFFLTMVLDNVILPNISKKNREARKNNCQSFFSSDTLLMVLKAGQVFKEKCESIFFRAFPKNMTEKDRLDYANYIIKKKATEESIKQIMLGCLFEDLCLRLQTLRAETVINIVGRKQYEENPTLQIVQVRSNFFFLGEALRALLTGKPITFKQEFLTNFRNFIEQKNLDVDNSAAPQDGLNWRERIFMRLEEYKPPDELANFDQFLIQVAIEESMQLINPICTFQLRNIVYIHNQLILYGDKHIYKRGFREISNNQQAGVIPVKQNSKKVDDEAVAQESEQEVKIDEEEYIEMDPCKLVMQELGNQYIILRIQRIEFITQQVLNVQINMQIRTRIFESYQQFVRCNECNAIVYEGLLPRQRFIEGLNMKKWTCGNPTCKYENVIEISLSCKKCGSARQKSTLPVDLIFPLYVPPNAAIEINRQTNIFERVLKVIPMIDMQESLTQELNKLKLKEKEKPMKDFEKIKIIEDCSDMVENYVLKNRASFGYTGKESQTEDVQISIKVQDSLYDTLQEQIRKNIQRRKEHQAVLNRNIALILQLKERLLASGNQQEILMSSLNKVEQNAKVGVGNEEFKSSDFQGTQIKSGNMRSQNKAAANGDKDKQDDQKDDIGKYFADMKKKSELQIPNAKLQKKLEENKARRQLMQSQFGQFSSFDAIQMIQDGVIFDDIKIDSVDIKTIINQCKFLFYELREDPENDNLGGYRVELSFEEKASGLIGACLPGQKGSQSILSSFVISNEVLTEMKRIMATKCTVRFQGTRFNIFKLVKLIGSMKTKNQAVQISNS